MHVNLRSWPSYINIGICSQIMLCSRLPPGVFHHDNATQQQRNENELTRTGVTYRIPVTVLLSTLQLSRCVRSEAGASGVTSVRCVFVRSCTVAVVSHTSWRLSSGFRSTFAVSPESRW
jgi:hypothetical protein